jgi:hypothetical protein
MKVLRSARWIFLATLLSLFVPAASHAGVFISVAIAPPVLPVYDQPPCPEPGWIWTPGYWAYDYDNGGYYWVPGTWVPAPYVGALWTPGYWGWEQAVYIWHPGYWGRHVGYYGGVNYGFGYFGVGFAGGMWRGNVFAYNTAVWHIDRERIHEVYEDRREIDRDTIRNDRRVAFSGGPGGIRHDPTPNERNFMREDHMQPTSFQQQHIEAAQHDRNAFFNNNHGRPATVVAARPMTPGPAEMRPNGNQENRGGGNLQSAPNQGGARPGYNTPPQPNEPQGMRPGYSNPAQQNQPYPNGNRNQQQNQPSNNVPAPNVRNAHPERRPPEQLQVPQQAPQTPPQQQMRQEPQQQPRQMPQQAHPQPEVRQAPPQHQELHPAPQSKDRGNDHDREH